MIKQTMLTICKHKEKFYAMIRVLMIQCASRIAKGSFDTLLVHFCLRGRYIIGGGWGSIVTDDTTEATLSMTMIILFLL